MSESSVPQLRALRVLATAMIEMIDGLLPPSVQPLPPEVVIPDCAAGRHPSNSVQEAPTMGRINRKVCMKCQIAFEEGVDGETV